MTKNQQPRVTMGYTSHFISFFKGSRLHDSTALTSTDTTEISSTNMFRLLDLPLELRDQIYASALYQPGKNLHNYATVVCSVSGPPNSASLALLCLNRQIHDEVKDLIRRLKAREPLRYTAELYAFKNYNLVVNWTLLPYVSPNIDCIDIHVPPAVFEAITRDTNSSQWAVIPVAYATKLVQVLANQLPRPRLFR